MSSNFHNDRKWATSELHSDDDRDLPLEELSSPRLITETKVNIVRYLKPIAEWFNEELVQIGRMGHEGNEISKRRKAIIQKNSFWPPHASLCKYGEKCTRNNPNHFQHNAHPVSHPFVKEQVFMNLRFPNQEHVRKKDMDSHNNDNNNNNNNRNGTHAEATRPTIIITNADEQNHQEEGNPRTHLEVDDHHDTNERIDQDANKSSADGRKRDFLHKTTTFLSSYSFADDIDLPGISPLSSPNTSPRSSGSFSAQNELATNETDSPFRSPVSSPAAYKKNEELTENVNRTDNFLDTMSEQEVRRVLKELYNSQMTLAQYLEAQNKTNETKQVRSQYDAEEKLLHKPSINTAKINPNKGLFDDDSGYWNNAFQRAVNEVRQLSPNTKQENRMRVYNKLTNLGKNFISAAKTYGKLIISEVYLEPSKKTIKPLFGKGFAGGDKYLIHGILFKFAVDSNQLYGGDEGAMKVAGHELRHLNQVFNCWVQGLRLPMSVAKGIRNRWFITKLLSDASKGGVVHHDDPKVNDKMKQLCQSLNLADHRVGKDSVCIYSPIDLEAHHGLVCSRNALQSVISLYQDNHYYLLDFSRMFPPVEPDPSVPSSYLVNLFRPEFVKAYSRPLSSDAFSPFVNDVNEAQHNQDIRKATQYLFNTVIPQYAQNLLSVEKEIDRRHQWLVQDLHLHGINVRYLGRVRNCMSATSGPDYTNCNSYWRFMLLLEMLSRTIKQILRSKLRVMMRELKQPGDEPYKRVVIEELNSIFGERLQSRLYWQDSLKVVMQKKFAHALTPQEQAPEYSLKEFLVKSQQLGLQDGRSLLFDKVCKMLGLVFSQQAVTDAMENPKIFEFQRPFDETDLESIQETVKHMNIVSHSEGMVLQGKATKKKKDEAYRLYLMAIERFKQALESNPDNRNSLRNLADCYMHIDENPLAAKCYLQAIKLAPNDTNTLFKYACFLDKCGATIQAEEYYLKSLEADPFHRNCMTVYADFVAYCRCDFETAEEFYSCALKPEPGNMHILNNYACLLMMRKKYKEAAQMFQESLANAPEHPVALKNYAIFLHKLNRYDEARQYFTRYKVAAARLRSISLTDTV